MMSRHFTSRILPALLGLTLAAAGKVEAEAGADFLVMTYEADSRLLEVNPDTGAYTPIGATGVGFLTDLAYTSAGKLFATSKDSLYAVNPTTAAMTLIGAFGTTSSMVGLTSAPDGSLYGVAQSGGGVYRINPATGGATELFSTSHFFTGDIAYASGTTFYATATESNGTHLIRLDTAAMTTADLGAISNGPDIPALDFDLTGRLIGFARNGDIYAIPNYATSGTGTLLSHTGLLIGGAGIIPAGVPSPITAPEPPSGTLLGLGGLLALGWARRHAPVGGRMGSSRLPSFLRRSLEGPSCVTLPRSRSC